VRLPRRQTIGFADQSKWTCPQTADLISLAPFYLFVPPQHANALAAGQLRQLKIHFIFQSGDN
jgi:hypothetical protein